MKKTNLIIAMLLANTYLFSQISLEQTYAGNSIRMFDFGIVMLENSGKKYFKYEENTYTLNLYNLDHSIYKTINFDITPIVDTSIYINSEMQQINYITENLFDLDNEIEFLFSYFYYYGGPVITKKEGTLIINENGAIIFNEPNYIGVEYHMTHQPTIESTSNGTKMILFTSDTHDAANVYSLPGNLPCTNPCADSLTTGKKIINPEPNILNSISAYPNPTKDYINVDYTLPQGVNQGDIVFYDFQGKEIKRYKVDRAFDHLRISTNDFPAGVYLFNLQTSKGISEGKKVIKIE